MDEQDHKALALWAAQCAEHVLGHFEAKRPQDDRPRRAIEAARAWVRGEIRVGQARSAALAAHAAARETEDAAARAAARAAGHAVASAHVPTHAPHAAAYAVKAVTAAAPGSKSEAAAVAAAEREWQYSCLPEHLRAVLLPMRGSS